MEPQNNQSVDQSVNSQGTGEGLAANAVLSSLAFITHHNEQLMPVDEQDPNAPVESQNAPGQEMEPKQDNSQDETKFNDFEAKMDEKLEILRREMKDTIKNEIKDAIKTALEDEED